MGRRLPRGEAREGFNGPGWPRDVPVRLVALYMVAGLETPILFFSGFSKRGGPSIDPGKKARRRPTRYRLR